MGHKKRSQTKPSPIQGYGLDEEEGPAMAIVEPEAKVKARKAEKPNGMGSEVSITSPNSSVKADCERALMALRRGNHTKALRLMRDSCSKNTDSALLHRVQGTIFVKIASLIEDPNSKQKNLKNALESAKKAVILSPGSIEFAHFYANLLYEASSDTKDFEEVVQECERALSIENPIDPGKENLQEESQQKLSTPGARIAHVQQELRSLVQKANIASISAWMKNLGNGSGEEKFRLIPMRRLSEDPMEVRVSPSRRPNEIKKITKTEEDRRKEIEVRIAAARLLQQTPLSSSLQEKGGESLSSSDNHHPRRRPGSNRKSSNAVGLDRMDQFRVYWGTMGPDRIRREFLMVDIGDLRDYCSASSSSRDGLSMDLLSESFSFFQANKTWVFWVCCQCNEKFVDADVHLQHVVREHMRNLSPKLQMILPQEVDNILVEQLLHGSWRPVDTHAAIKLVTTTSGFKDCSLGDGTIAEEDTRGYEDENGSAMCIPSSPEAVWREGTSNSGVVSSETLGEGTNCERTLSEIEHGRWSHSSSKEALAVENWPLSDDAERLKLLERIHGMFQVLLMYKCLAAGQLHKVIQYTLDELQGIMPNVAAICETPLCICFLDVAQLQKVLKFLQELSHSCGLGRNSDKNNSSEEGADVGEGERITERIEFDSSCLLLDDQLLKTDVGKNDERESSGGSDALLSWIFMGPSYGEQHLKWVRLRGEKARRGIELLQMLEKEFDLLESLCKRKCEHLDYEEALNTVECLRVEEFKRREEHVTKLGSRTYEALLRRRQEELIERENDLPCNKIELDAIANILKEAQALSMTQFGYDETLSGVTSRLSDLDCADDEEWRMQDFLHQPDSCIEVAIQRQKEHLSLELSKIDAKIMRNVSGMQQLEIKLGQVSCLDYRAVILPLIKSFLRAHLEELVDKDATEKSDAAREAFLTELAREAKKNTNSGGDFTKQVQDKSKDKKKNKDYRRSKEFKGPAVNEQHVLQRETSDKFNFVDAVADDRQESEVIDAVTADDSKQQEEEFKRQIELEAEERKLEETLEYQRRIEEEAKQKHLAEQHKRVFAKCLDNVAERGLSLSVKVDHKTVEPIRHSKEVSFFAKGSPLVGKEMNFGHDLPPAIVPSPSDNWDAGLHKSINSFGSNELLLNSVEKFSFSHDENSPALHSDQETFVDTNIKARKESASSCVGPAERTSISASSSDNSNNKKYQRTNNFGHTKSKPEFSSQRDGEFGASQSVRRAKGQGNRQATRTKSLGQNPRLPSPGIESHRIENMAVEGNTKERTRVVDPNLSCGGDKENGIKTLRQLHAEEDDEERFQADLQKAVRQSLDIYQAHHGLPLPGGQSKRVLKQMDGIEIVPNGARVGVLNQSDVIGTGLQNEVGEYNCFLNVIIQSLWHIRRFRDEFLGKPSSLHVHVGDPCVVCALHYIFTSMSVASAEMRKETVAPTCLRVALSNLYPDSNFFQEAQMNDASEVLAVIFDCLHGSSTSGSTFSDAESEGSCMGSWDCASSTCVAHTLFGMDIYEQMNCSGCGLESRHLKYTSFFHNINANALRTMKITCSDNSLDMLLKLVEMNHQLACDPEAGGCGRLNYIHHILSAPPHVFTIVLGWQNTSESLDDISATLAALTTELDIGVIYRGLEEGNKHCIVSVLVGGWNQVLDTCQRGHLQPQVLFFEALQ
ncbi:hypothetical protein AMTRI_Chr12g237590 [Amborella trichopoda]